MGNLFGLDRASLVWLGGSDWMGIRAQEGLQQWIPVRPPDAAPGGRFTLSGNSKAT